MALSRREYILCSAGIVSLTAGCTDTSSDSGADPSGSGGYQDDSGSSDTDGDGVQDSLDDYPSDPDRSRLVTSEDDTRNIEEDHWRYYPLNFSRTGYLSYNYIVRDGPAIDVILLDKSEYNYFKEGERFSYYSELSILDSIGESRSGSISSGSYYLIFDNSEAGRAYPPSNMSNDVVNVEFDFKAYI